jgi:hypothetical protein
MTERIYIGSSTHTLFTREYVDSLPNVDSLPTIGCFARRFEETKD